MMVMFVLFAALLTVQAVKQKEIIETETSNQPDKINAKQSTAPDFAPLMQINVFEQSKKAISETNLEMVDIVVMSDQSVKVSVQSQMFFEPGKAELRGEVKQFLDKLARVIRQTPYQVNVIGHTDDFPINTDAFPSNWELSLNRASQVTRYLIQSTWSFYLRNSVYY